MPTFDTPSPIQIRIDLSGGSVRVRASDRADTVVTVRPEQRGSVRRRPGRRPDTGRVRRRPAGRHLAAPAPAAVLRAARRRSTSRSWSRRARHARAALTAGDVDCEGRLGDVRIDDRVRRHPRRPAATLHGSRTSAGDIAIARGRRRRPRPAPPTGRCGSARRGRPAAGQRLRRHHRRARARLGRGDHQVRPGQRPPGRRRLAGPRHRLRQGRGRHPRGHRRLAGPRVVVRQGPQPAHAVRRPGRLRGAPARSAPAPPTATSSSGAPEPPRTSSPPTES